MVLELLGASPVWLGVRSRILAIEAPLGAPKSSRKQRKRNGIAAALKSFIPKIVKPKKGKGSYTRRAKTRKNAS
jgi:stalled ribosome alternative rescue factor ArfA